MKNKFLRISISLFLICITFSAYGCKRQKVDLDYDDTYYKYISISASFNKIVGRESTDTQLIKDFLSDIKKLQLIPSKKETDVISEGDYWVQLRDNKDPFQAKYSILFRPMGNTLMINDNVYAIKKGQVNFKEYYNKCNPMQEN